MTTPTSRAGTTTQDVNALRYWDGQGWNPT